MCGTIQNTGNPVCLSLGTLGTDGREGGITVVTDFTFKHALQMLTHYCTKQYYMSVIMLFLTAWNRGRFSHIFVAVQHHLKNMFLASAHKLYCCMVVCIKEKCFAVAC